MLPLYRDGDTIIVSPTAAVRRGDRVVVKTLKEEGAGQAAQAPDAEDDRAGLARPDHPDRVLNFADIAAMARVIWASP